MEYSLKNICENEGKPTARHGASTHQNDQVDRVCVYKNMDNKEYMSIYSLSSQEMNLNAYVHGFRAIYRGFTSILSEKSVFISTKYVKSKSTTPLPWMSAECTVPYIGVYCDGINNVNDGRFNMTVSRFYTLGGPLLILIVCAKVRL